MLWRPIDLSRQPEVPAPGGAGLEGSGHLNLRHGRACPGHPRP